MVIDYDIKSKIDIDLFEDYDCEGHPKYDHNVDINYNIKNIEIKDSVVVFDIERTFEDITPLEYEKDNGEVSMVLQKYITWHKLVINRHYLDEAIKKGECVKAKVETCSMYNQDLLKTDVVSGPMLTEDEAEEMFEYLDDSIVNDTILLAASVE